ncbi:MAG: DUF4234 domain-containing protein [Oscillospiraceae bacterium]|nr:DUF4234 domain-containing protein [Oscillospiraceae bacterium]
MQLQERGIALYIILSIITCGIFGIYWYYCIASDLYNNRHNIPTTPVLTIVLYIVTGGIYGIFVYYKWGQAMTALCREHSIPDEDRAILYVILALFGFSIINMALIQNDLNQLARIG